MKTTLTLLCGLAMAASARDAVLDLTNLAAYASQEVPEDVDRDNTPPDNPITDAGATLGRVLFYDQRLSKNGTISCASCHQQKHAFGDPAVASTGVAGTTGRHSMRLINARFGDEEKFFWDERAPDLERQSTQPIRDHVEMGFSGSDGDPDFAALVARISDLELYRVLFTAVFASPEITEARMQLALAQFVRSIQSFDSKYDEGLSSAPNPNADFVNFTARENLGKRLFSAPPGPGGGAGCAACHRPPVFDIDPNSGHNGVTTSLSGGSDLSNTRSPSLRDLVAPHGRENGPFMHDGSKATLLEVVNHYNAIPGGTPGLDPRLAGPPPRPGISGPTGQRLGLSEEEKTALVAFLGTLTGAAVYADEKWADPFDDEGRLSLVVLPTQVEVSTASGRRWVRARGVPRVRYLIEFSNDLQRWEEGVAVTATAEGEVLYEIDAAPDAGFYRFVYQPGS